MSMTLPRWFGRKARKKSGKHNIEIPENVCEYKSNPSQDSIIYPNEYIVNENISPQGNLLRLDTLQPNIDESNYAQDIYGNRLKDIQESQVEQDIQNISSSSYKTRENYLDKYSFAEREKHHLSMSSAMYSER